MLQMNGSKNNSKCILYLFLVVTLIARPLTAKTLLVGPTKELKSIKIAIEMAANGDTIKVEKGIYNEGMLRINKSITLIGIDYPTVSGGGNDQILHVTSNGVTITQIKFVKSGVSFINDNAAIKLDGVENCVIESNIFEDNFFAIYLAKSLRCVITKNKITASGIKETYSGNGIHLWYCKEITISKNDISGHRDGIYLEFVRSSLIENNVSYKNLRYGLHFMFSDSCSYSNNVFNNNGAGVAVMYSHYVRMFENKFENNWGAGSYGLLLKEISNSEIESNSFYKNSSAIYFEGCSNNISQKNDFIENGWAIRLMANSMNNIFRQNNFIGNTFDVSTNSRRNYNTFIQNYWSKYNGYDLDKNGFGDVPFRPVKLFSIIIEKNRPALILLRSFFVDLLDAAEYVFPSLTPDALVDENPLMKKRI